jgi:hypothetical protein
VVHVALPDVVRRIPQALRNIMMVDGIFVPYENLPSHRGAS